MYYSWGSLAAGITSEAFTHNISEQSEDILFWKTHNCICNGYVKKIMKKKQLFDGIEHAHVKI